MSLADKNPQTSEWVLHLQRHQSAESTIRQHKRHLDYLLEFVATNGGPDAEAVKFQTVVPWKKNGISAGCGPANFRFVEQFLSWLLSRKSQGAVPLDDDKAARIHNRALYTLRPFFRHLLETGVLHNDPTYHVEPAREIRTIHHDKYLRPFQSVDLVKGATNSGDHAPRNVALVITMLRAGLRPSELCNLAPEGINFHTERIRTEGKNGKREAPMPPALAEVLTWYLVSPYYTSRFRPGARLFNDDDGKTPLTSERLGGIFKDLLQAAGIYNEVTAYWLRHTFATDLNRYGVPFPLIGQALGHKRLKNTLHYVHEREPRLRRIIEEGPAGRPLLNVHRKLYHAVQKEGLHRSGQESRSAPKDGTTDKELWEPGQGRQG